MSERRELTSAKLHAAILVSVARWADQATDAAALTEIEAMRIEILHLAGNLRSAQGTLDMLMRRLRSD